MKNKARCAYCSIPAIKERMIIKNDLAWAFPTNIPIVPGHVLIAPLRCVAFFEDLTDKEKSAIFDMCNKLKKSLTVVFQAEGFNYAWNEGEIAGQSIPHFHLHMLPRKAGDDGITKYEPRKFLYRPGSREQNPEEELRVVSELIRNEIK
jgi:histidine triad (HIT) family protein